MFAQPPSPQVSAFPFLAASVRLGPNMPSKVSLATSSSGALRPLSFSGQVIEKQRKQYFCATLGSTMPGARQVLVGCPPAARQRVPDGD